MLLQGRTRSGVGLMCRRFELRCHAHHHHDLKPRFPSSRLHKLRRAFAFDTATNHKHKLHRSTAFK